MTNHRKSEAARYCVELERARADLEATKLGRDCWVRYALIQHEEIDGLRAEIEALKEELVDAQRKCDWHRSSFFRVFTG